MFHRLVAAIPVLVLPTPATHPGPIGQRIGGDVRDSRTQPLTVADALFSIPGVTGRMQLAGDLDGDGRADLVAERGSEWGDVTRIDAVSSRDGHTIRTLWSTPSPGCQIDWDAGGDVDGDGVPDLLIGLPEADVNGGRAGKVSILSGADGTVLRDMPGTAEGDHFGGSVAFLDDLDGDGRCEYAVGSPQCDVSVSLLGVPDGLDFLRMTFDEDDKVSVSKNGELVDVTESWLKHLERRSPLFGYVSAYSGSDGRPLWRVDGELPGHAFGVRMRAIGDSDGDGHADLIVGSDPKSWEPLLLVSGSDGRVVDYFRNNGGPFGSAGDLDGDGAGDVFLDRMDPDRREHHGSTQIVTARGAHLTRLQFPDWSSPYSTTILLGDVDGDDTPDFLLGDANFHIRKPEVPTSGNGAELLDLRSLTLTEALELETNPWNAFAWESGAAWVYSGRSRSVILGAWGEPGSSDGMGLAGAPIPDLTGDGYPEIAICDSNGAHVFAGPGPDPLHEPK